VKANFGGKTLILNAGPPIGSTPVECTQPDKAEPPFAGAQRSTLI